MASSAQVVDGSVERVDDHRMPQYRLRLCRLPTGLFSASYRPVWTTTNARPMWSGRDSARAWPERTAARIAVAILLTGRPDHQCAVSCLSLSCEWRK